MLIPQFTLRRLMTVTALIAVLSLIVTWGSHGTAWAVGVTALLVLLVVTFAVHVALFGIIWLVSQTSRRATPQSVLVFPSLSAPPSDGPPPTTSPPTGTA